MLTFFDDHDTFCIIWQIAGEPGVGLQSLAFQLPDTDCLNETAFPIDEMVLDSETFFDPSFLWLQ